MERHLLPWPDQQQARFLHQLPTSCLTCRWCSILSRFHIWENQKLTLTPNAAQMREQMGQVRSRQALLYGLLQQTEDFHSNFQVRYHCMNVFRQKDTKGWSVRGVWYAFSNIFSDRQSHEAKHIEHRRTLKLPRWGKIVRPQPRQRVVTLSAGEFIANALNIFGTDDRKIQKRGP